MAGQPHKHALKSRYRKDPRSEEERRSGLWGGRSGVSRRRDTEYYCSCGKVYGNIPTKDAERQHTAHKSQRHDHG